MAFSYFLILGNLVLIIEVIYLLDFIFLVETKPYLIVEVRLLAKITRQFRAAIKRKETTTARPMQLG